MPLLQSHTPWYRDGYKVGMFGYSRSTKDKLTVTRSGAGVVNPFVVNNLDFSPVKHRDALPSRRTQAVWVFRLDERVTTWVLPARRRAPGRSRSTPELLGTGSPSNRDRSAMAPLLQCPKDSEAVGVVRARRARLAPTPGGWSERPTARQTARRGPPCGPRGGGVATA